MTIAARNLTFGYHKDVATLRDVSVEIPAGQVTAIIGPNGAGKSTLLRLLAGVRTPWSGDVSVNGESMDRLSARERAARVALVSQRPAVAGPYTVEQVVSLGRYALARREDAVEGALRAMELLELRARLLSELSVGQQQRVAIARALAQLGALGESLTGKAMLADEPVAAMDPRHSVVSMRLMREMAERGAAVALVLHDLTSALNWTDRAILLTKDGQLLAQDEIGAALTPDRLAQAFGARFQILRSGAVSAIAIDHSFGSDRS